MWEFIAGGITVFVSFYAGVSIGQKLKENKKVAITIPKVKRKPTKAEKEYTEGLTNLMEFKG